MYFFHASAALTLVIQWSYGGDEVQIISDLIAEEINWGVLYDVYGGLTGPWAIRSRIRDQIESVVSTTGQTIACSRKIPHISLSHRCCQARLGRYDHYCQDAASQG